MARSPPTNAASRSSSCWPTEAKTPEDRAQWLRQEADVINEAVPRGKFPGGIERLTALRDKCVAAGQEDLAAYMQFRLMTAAYNKAMAAGNVDIPGNSEKMAGRPGTVRQRLSQERRLRPKPCCNWPLPRSLPATIPTPANGTAAVVQDFPEDRRRR